jgi:hypothetical protein
MAGVPTPPREPVTRQEKLIAELRGVDCRCGKRKRRDHTFCGQCFGRLPSSMKNALYLRIGHGYEKAYDAAVAQLSKRST